MFFRLIIFILFFGLPPAFGSDISLKEKLAEAQQGSFLVVEQNKTYTFYLIREREAKTVAIEEISIPASRFAKLRLQWRDWLEQGAPGHSSWTISYIDVTNGQFEKSYSYTHQGWLDLAKATPFLTNLLNLKFQSVPDSHRRKIGLPPGYGKKDKRPLWHPRVIVDGAVLPNVPSSVWKAKWPNDGSDMSKKYVHVYLPEAGNAAIPSFFPFWLEVEGKFGTAKVRVIDSGTGARSPY